MPAPSLPSLNQWRSFFKSRGIDAETANTYLTYVRPLVRNGVPVIFDREHFAKLLGRTEHFLAAASFSPQSFYRNFAIPKRTGGTRDICAPYRSLLECQRWIAENILSALPIHTSAVGYVVGRSIKDHASPHLGAKVVLTTDIEGFFPTIRLPRVIAVFRGLGYSIPVSTSLARLCCLENVLPQGAPTSPILSNIVCLALDKKLVEITREAGLVYTRYADDMCFSGPEIHEETVRHLENAVASEGFKLNRIKTRLHTGQSNLRVVTGINIALGKMSLPKPFKRAISSDLYHIEKHGLRSHLAKRKIRDSNYLHSLYGKVGYWLFIEPDNQHAHHFREVLARLIED